MSIATPGPLLTVDEMATLANVPAKWLQFAAYFRWIPSLVAGGQYRFSPDAVLHALHAIAGAPKPHAGILQLVDSTRLRRELALTDEELRELLYKGLPHFRDKSRSLYNLDYVRFVVEESRAKRSTDCNRPAKPLGRRSDEPGISGPFHTDSGATGGPTHA